MDGLLFFLEQLSMVILTPVIAVTVMFIAYRQYKLDQERHTLYLHEKRVKLFMDSNAVFGLISEALTPDDIDWCTLIELVNKSLSSFKVNCFVVEPGIQEHLVMINSKALELYRLYKKSVTLPEGEERNEMVCKQQMILDWLKEQSNVSEKKFQRYFRIWFK